MSESYESNTTDLAAFLVRHLEAQHRNITTVRSVRKATRSCASTVVTRRDARIIHAPRLSSVHDRYFDSHGGTATGENIKSRSVLAGGQLRLSDLHK